MNEEKIGVVITCPKCGKKSTVVVTQEQYIQIVNHSAHIQDILPNESVQVRELFLSGFCFECQDKIFNSFEDEDGEEI